MDTTDMSSTAANAATSEFLMLPTELRCRIYEYVFGNNFIHICNGLDDSDLASRYKLTVCDCPEAPDFLPPRLGLIVPIECSPGYPHCLETHVQNCVRTATHHDLSLGLLSVCRKVYHEAVLEPFKQATFIQLTRYDSKALAAFIDRLVPAQAEAITRLRQFVWAGRVFTPPQLRGLKHLDLLLCQRTTNVHYPDYRINSASWLKAGEIMAIKRLGLDSIKLSIEFRNQLARERDQDHQGLLENADFIFGWLHKMQSQLLEE